jgi:hypothetical protein
MAEEEDGLWPLSCEHGEGFHVLFKCPSVESNRTSCSSCVKGASIATGIQPIWANRTRMSLQGRCKAPRRCLPSLTRWTAGAVCCGKASSESRARFMSFWVPRQRRVRGNISIDLDVRCTVEGRSVSKCENRRPPLPFYCGPLLSGVRSLDIEHEEA